jgi:hypothetical protein
MSYTLIKVIKTFLLYIKTQNKGNFAREIISFLPPLVVNLARCGIDPRHYPLIASRYVYAAAWHDDDLGARAVLDRVSWRDFDEAVADDRVDRTRN